MSAHASLVLWMCSGCRWLNEGEKLRCGWCRCARMAADNESLVRLAGLEPATPSLEGSCSGPSELQAPNLNFNSVGRCFHSALAHGGLAVNDAVRAVLLLAARIFLLAVQGLVAIERHARPRRSEVQL